MRRVRGCARLGAQRQQLEREPLTLLYSAPIGPWAPPHHSSPPLFQLRSMSVITTAPEKTCGVRPAGRSSNPARRTSHHHLAVSNVRGAPEAR